MKGQYITKQIRMAYLTKPRTTKGNIHAELEETIRERKRIMQRLENRSQAARVVDMYLGNPKAA
jgi:hypothetical protein